MTLFGIVETSFKFWHESKADSSIISNNESFPSSELKSNKIDSISSQNWKAQGQILFKFTEKGEILVKELQQLNASLPISTSDESRSNNTSLSLKQFLNANLPICVMKDGITAFWI